jgi:hypothetical protein
MAKWSELSPGKTLKKKLLLVAVTPIALVVAWALLVFATGEPMMEEDYYSCSVCRAGRTVTSYFTIPVRTKIYANEFSLYYLSHVDPRHRHTWLGRGLWRVTRTSQISAHGGSGPLNLHYRAALAIMKSLPDRESQKAFFERLSVVDDTERSNPKTFIAIERLNAAYYANKNRRDWLQQVRRVGLYP